MREASKACSSLSTLLPSLGKLTSRARVMGSGGLKKGPSLTCGHSPPPESGGTLVLVSQDGIQRPPLHFPQGGHLLSFLSCLENGLLPRGQLEPPLWTQQGKVPWQGRLWVQGWVKEGLLSFFPAHSFRNSFGWDLGWDCALDKLTPAPSTGQGFPQATETQ